MKTIESQGISYSREEQHEGLVAMAAPVFDLYSCVVGSILVTLPIIRFVTEKEKIIEESLREEAQRLSRLLGCGSTSRGMEKGTLKQKEAQKKQGSVVRHA